MKIFLTKLLSVFTLLAALMMSANLNAQSLSAAAGADLVSRYVWRGMEINNTPNLQPSLSVSALNFELGVWGSYTLSNQSFASDEIDFYLSYGFNTAGGDFSLLITDYYYPNAGVPIDEFDDGAGAHTVEFAVGYAGPEYFPVTLLAAYNFYNDPGNNLYLEIGYPFTISKIDFNTFLGATPGSKDNPVYYGTSEFAIINIGLTASKEVRVTEDFSLPLSTSFIINPNTKIAYMVFGVGFSL